MQKRNTSRADLIQPTSASIRKENDELANKYCPYLVMFPEIRDGSSRQDHHHEGHSMGSDPPLDWDYHPRDISLILDNASLPPNYVQRLLLHLPWIRSWIRKKLKPSREELLDKMDRNKIDHIDLIDEKGPEDVDKFWRTYAEIRNKDGNPEYRRKTYTRIIRGSSKFRNYVSIQYWLPYFFDDWANVHEMDWEMVSVILRKEGDGEQPIACIYNAHLGSFKKDWKGVEKVDNEGNIETDASHPVVYVANGSHASYFSDYPPTLCVAEPYVKDMLKTLARTVGIGMGFIDYVPIFEKGDKHFPEVEVIPEPDRSIGWTGEWRWLNFKGNWGSPAELNIFERLMSKIPIVGILINAFKRPIREGGPPGPNARPDSCWNRPFIWANLESVPSTEYEQWPVQLDDKRTG